MNDLADDFLPVDDWDHRRAANAAAEEILYMLEKHPGLSPEAAERYGKVYAELKEIANS